MRKLILATIAATSLLFGAACSHREPEPPRPFDGPMVALRNVRMSGAGVTGGSLEAELYIYNPNGFNLRVPRVTYRVLADTVHLARGISDPDVVVAARDSVKVRLPATFSYAGLGRSGRALVNRGSVSYRVFGWMTVGSPYGTYQVPYDRAGSFAPLGAYFPH